MEEKVFSFEADVALNVIKIGGKIVIDDINGTNEEEYFVKMLVKHGIEYEVIDEASDAGDWPTIRFSGEKEKLFHIMSLISASGYTYGEIKKMLKKWNGEENEMLSNVLF